MSSVVTVRRLLRVARSAGVRVCASSFHGSAVTFKQQKTLAICREEYNVWERRAPLSPAHVQTLTREGVRVLVQPSSRRAYSNRDYEKEGATLAEDISEADLLIGVKKPPIYRLIPGKTYVFFSHTIKRQSENMELLDNILDKDIRLVDYECIVDADGRRVVAFGKYAGVCGMINILHGLGLRLLALGHHTPFMYIGAAHNYPSTVSAKAAINALGREIQHGSIPKILGPMVFVFTGSGNVSKGAQEVFQQLPHEFVPLDSLKKVVEYGDTRKLYGAVVDKHHHLVRKDGRPYSDQDFAENPLEYKATFFERAMPYATCLVNGVFWMPGTPKLITKEQARTLHPWTFSSSSILHEGMPKLPQRLQAVADISNDAGGSLELIKYDTTIDHPFIVQNLHTREISDDMSANGVVVMTIDNLPAQVPRESTDYFGSKMLPLIKDCLKIDGKQQLKDYNISDTIKKAVITHNGELTDRFKYIKSSSQSSALKDMI